MVADKHYTWPLSRHVIVAFRVPQGPLGRAGKVRKAHLSVRWCDGYGLEPHARNGCRLHVSQRRTSRFAFCDGWRFLCARRGTHPLSTISLAFFIVCRDKALNVSG